MSDYTNMYLLPERVYKKLSTSHTKEVSDAINSNPVKQLNKFISSPINQMNNIEAQSGSHINISNCDSESNKTVSNDSKHSSSVVNDSDANLHNLENDSINSEQIEVEHNVEKEPQPVDISQPDERKIELFNQSHPNEQISTTTTQSQTESHPSVTSEAQTETYPSVTSTTQTETPPSVISTTQTETPPSVQTQTNDSAHASSSTQTNSPIAQANVQKGVTKNQSSPIPNDSSSSQLSNETSELTKRWMNLSENKQKKLSKSKEQEVTKKIDFAPKKIETISDDNLQTSKKSSEIGYYPKIAKNWRSLDDTKKLKNEVITVKKKKEFPPKKKTSVMKKSVVNPKLKVKVINDAEPIVDLVDLASDQEMVDAKKKSKIKKGDNVDAKEYSKVTRDQKKRMRYDESTKNKRSNTMNKNRKALNEWKSLEVPVRKSNRLKEQNKLRKEKDEEIEKFTFSKNKNPQKKINKT